MLCLKNVVETRKQRYLSHVEVGGARDGILQCPCFLLIFVYTNFLSGKLCVIYQAAQVIMISFAVCASLCFYTELNSSCFDLLLFVRSPELVVLPRN